MHDPKYRIVYLEARKLVDQVSDPEDKDVAGFYGVEVLHDLSDSKTASVALDIFHSNVPVSNPDEFIFTVCDGDSELEEDPEYESGSGISLGGQVYHAEVTEWRLSLNDLPADIFNSFAELVCRLSPENLSCDGEASEEQIRQTCAEVGREWKGLERTLGRRVTREEIEGIHSRPLTRREPTRLFENNYRCPDCSHHWQDVWSATCDSTCPNCAMRNISPFFSKDLM